MKKQTDRARIKLALHRFHQRHGVALGLVANTLGIAAGLGWLIGFLPASPVWAWPAVAACALVAAALALYRAQELDINSRELQEANRRLEFIAGDHILRGLDQFARDANASQQMPITQVAGLIHTLRTIQERLGGNPQTLDQIEAALAQYERMATKTKTH